MVFDEFYIFTVSSYSPYVFVKQLQKTSLNLPALLLFLNG